jgi:hypothetical protein
LELHWKRLKQKPQRVLTNSKNRAPLVLISEEGETPGFAGGLVTYEVHIHHLAVPENGDRNNRSRNKSAKSV